MAEPSTATEMVRVPILGENGRISDDYIPESIPQAVTAAEQAAESAASSANQALQQAAAAEKSASSATGSVEQAKTYANNASTYMTTAESHAESAAADANAASTSASEAAASAAAAEESNKSAAQSSADAMGFRNNAVQYRDQAREAAQEAEGYVTTVQQLSQNATNSATAAQNSATSASASAETATTAASQASASATNAAASAQTASEKAASVLDHYIESATATTLDAGQSATATVVDNVLQLGIPRGDKGDPGEVSAVQVAAGSDLSVSTDEGTVTIDDYALRARISELEQQTQNVVTGTSTGLVSHGEDAFPQKPREVRIKGKTWVNRWPAINGGAGGIKVTTDETGLITVSGSRDDGGNGTGNITGAGADIVLVAGRTYVFSVSTADGLVTSSSETGIMLYITGEGSPYWELSLGGRMSGTITVPAQAQNPKARVGVTKTVSETVNASFRVMLVDGTEAPDCFTPPASIASVETGKLVTSGKNLLDISTWTKVGKNGQLTVQPDGSLKCDGYMTLGIDGFVSPILPPGSYHADVSDVTDGAQVGLACSVAQSGFKWNSTWSKYDCEYVAFNISNFTFVSSVPFRIGIMINSAEYGEEAQPTIYVYNPQLELGSTATSYELPTVTTTPLPEVELRSLPNGTCDELVIRADGTCEVERRTGYIASYTDEEVTGEYVSTGNGLEAGASIVYELDESTTEDQASVTLPTLPAPTFNQYHDADVPSDTSTQYARDINIVLSNLEAVQTALLGGE